MHKVCNQFRFAVLFAVDLTVFRDSRTVVVGCVATSMTEVTPVGATKGLSLVSASSVNCIGCSLPCKR